MFPVPQGERGILRAWSGQLSHLPPPAVGIVAPVAAGGLDIPVPGVSSKVAMLSENTAQVWIVLKCYGTCAGLCEMLKGAFCMSGRGFLLWRQVYCR